MNRAGEFCAGIGSSLTTYKIVLLSAPATSPHTTPARVSHCLIDLDGTLIQGNTTALGAAALLAAVEGRYMVVSNNSTDTALTLSRRLKRMGLTVPPKRLVLAGEVTINWLHATYPGARVYLAASAALRRHAFRLGCHLVEHDPDIVLLALDKRFDYRRLQQIANLIRDGAKLIATNSDRAHPGAGGRLVPETGALLASVVACSGVQPEHIVGKPAEGLFREALRRLRSTAAQTVMIGDNPDTDAAGAIAAGMSCLLVGKGEGCDARDLAQLLQQLRCGEARIARSLLPEDS